MTHKKAVKSEVHDNETVRNLSPQDFLQLGVDYVAYIKSVDIEGGKAYAIQGADGETLGMEESFDLALGMLEMTELNGVLVQ